MKKNVIENTDIDSKITAYINHTLFNRFVNIWNGEEIYFICYNKLCVIMNFDFFVSNLW